MNEIRGLNKLLYQLLQSKRGSRKEKNNKQHKRNDEKASVFYQTKSIHLFPFLLYII